MGKRGGVSGLCVDYLEYEKVPEKQTINPNSKIVAYCNSHYCMGGDPNNLNSYGILKHVSRSTDFCHECGSALFWIRVSDQKINKAFRNYKQNKKPKREIENVYNISKT